MRNEQLERPEPQGSGKTIEEYFAPEDIHELQREGQGGFVTMIVGLVLCLVETVLVYWVIADHISFALGMLLHIIIVAILAFCARVMAPTSEGRFVLLLLIAVATTGPFGAAGVVLSVLTYLWGSRKALSFEDWFSSIFPKQAQTTSQRIYDDILVGRDESSQSYSVISFLDVLSFGNEAQKRQALSKMTSNFHPQFASAFRKALSDRSNTIRVLAATGISKVESLFLERMMKLTELKVAHPKDPVVVWALAEHYDNYAYTGLLDFDREQINRQKALEHYYEYLQLVPSDVQARTRIGRILMRNKDYEKASDWFRQCIAQGFTSESISEWYSEALFACGRYDDLRRFRTSQPAVSTPGSVANPAMKEALNLWAGSKA